MTAVFLVCFVGGLLMAALLAISGDLHIGSLHHGGIHHATGHAGVHHAAGHHAHAGHSAAAHRVGGGHQPSIQPLQSVLGFVLSWLSPVTLAGAGLLFGGVGLLAGGTSSALPFAIVAAILGALLFRALMSAFLHSSSPALVLTGEGALATVNATIRPNAAGEVTYTLEGLHRNAIARSEDGLEIPRGTQVVITRREAGVAWVHPIDPIDQLAVLEEREG